MSTSRPSKKKAPKRGFALLSAEKMRAIASAGGRASHEKGTAHKWDSKTAAEAGRKGGRGRSKK